MKLDWRSRHSFRQLLLLIVVGASVSLPIVGSGCGVVKKIKDAKSGDYHSLSPATGGVYITIKRHATDAMVKGFDLCKWHLKWSDYDCGKLVLGIARDKIEKNLSGTALELWNGKYEVAKIYHPHIGKGFRDSEANDFAAATRDLRKRGHECLRVHWKSSGTNWTTCNDEGVKECDWGKELPE